MTYVRAFMALLGWLAVGALRVSQFVWRTPRRALRALGSSYRALTQAAALERPALVAIADDTYCRRTPPAQLSSGKQPVVLVFTGTGESIDSAFDGYRRLAAQVPELAEATEYVIEAPSSKGAYYSANTFAERMWRTVGPLAAQHPGPFVLFGLSRGALVALEVGTRIVQELAKPAAVLALSPPFDVPTELPVPVLAMASLEDVTEGLERASENLARPIRRAAEWLTRGTALFLTAMIIEDLGIQDPEELRRALLALDLKGTFESCRRSTYEFRLLQRVRAREAELFARELAALAARSPLFFACLVWGDTDNWVEPNRSQARVLAALAEQPAENQRLITVRVPQQGHPLFRGAGADAEPTLSCLRRVCEEASLRARPSVVRERTPAVGEGA